MNKAVWIWSWVCMFLGASIVIASRVLMSHLKKLEPYKGRSEATVIDIVAGEPDEKGKAKGIHVYYYPMFAYYARGQLIKVNYPRGSNPSRFHMNQKLKISYHLKHPERCKITRTDPLERLSKVMYYGGFILAALGCVLFLLYASRIL